MDDIEERLLYASTSPVYQRALFLEARNEIKQLRELVKTHEDWWKIHGQQCENYEAEIEKLRGELVCADMFHKIAIEQRGTAWKEIEQFKQMVRDAAQALNDEERENERLRQLLRDAGVPEWVINNE
jgi:predicted RNase H-like nuclease (RuvC/YqgF family)